MSTSATWPVSRNQLPADRANELDQAGEARIYKMFRHFWHPVAYSHEVQDEPVGVVLCGERLVVARLGDEVAVMNDLCAHRGAALSLGAIVDGEGGRELRCPYHGWRYDARGYCTLAPQRPDLAGHLRARVRRYPAVERFGLIWTCIEDQPVGEIPSFPQYDDPNFDKVTIPSTDWSCSAPRRTENYTDLSHLAIVHDGVLGDSGKPEVPDHRVWREEDDLTLMMSLEEDVEEPADSMKNAAMGAQETEVVVRRSWHVFMPLTVLLDSDAGGRHYCLFFHPTPVGPKTTRNFTVAARNYGSSERIAEEVIDLEEIVYGQDKPVVESQRPEELVEDLSYEMHVKGVDTFSVEYRRWLLDLAAHTEQLGR
ncbi:MAG: Rieske 2Fe-2S domain-containing protein [Actinobacteria bacterium]|nr:Rieske 2Fe-2S domain-containing protein [Actinomycetota bacterium]